MKNIQLTCADGYMLAATLFAPTAVRAAVMIAPATGIRRRFYQAFATHLAENGFGVITFDNRGIGDSLVGPVKKSDASLQRWGELDMPAVLDALKHHFPNTTYHVVGHSAGGQLLGLMHNAHELRSLFAFACSSGSLRNMSIGFKLQAHFFMNVFIPVNTLLFGYTNAQWVGMGEPLPRLVGAQWREWCNGTGYVKTAFGKTVHTHHYDSLTLPSYWLHAADDPIAIAANVRDMIGVYTKSKSEMRTLKPKEEGVREIGHMKFFSKSNQQLWKIAVDWLTAHSA